jgi:hypothetical protein
MVGTPSLGLLLFLKTPRHTSPIPYMQACSSVIDVGAEAKSMVIITTMGAVRCD